MMPKKDRLWNKDGLLVCYLELYIDFLDDVKRMTNHLVTSIYIKNLLFLVNLYFLIFAQSSDTILGIA